MFWQRKKRPSVAQGVELGYDLVQMSSHKYACGECAKYQGRVYSVSGKDKRYPALYETALKDREAVHEHCRHTFLTYIEKLADDPAEDRRLSNMPFVDTRTDEDRNPPPSIARKLAKRRGQ